MKAQYRLLAICLAFPGLAWAKGTDENPTQIEVLNFPDIQDVAITGTPNVNVASLPTVVVDDSIPINVNVSNSPPSYSFVGYTDIDQTVNVDHLLIVGQYFCRQKFGAGSRIATGREMRKAFETIDTINPDNPFPDLESILPPIQGSDPLPGGSGIPYGFGWFTADDSTSTPWVISFLGEVGEYPGGAIEGTVACSTPST